ncbi:MAG: hypothetical protein RMI74_06065 [Thermodesulfobacterium sp.]|nr:hypothetical protein [Thermodesulfobacterium sp.]
MGITYEKETLKLENKIGIEEVEKLLAYLLETEKLSIDMTKLSHLHTAIFQLLLVFQDKIEKIYPPEDKNLQLLIKGGFKL